MKVSIKVFKGNQKSLISISFNLKKMLNFRGQWYLSFVIPYYHPPYIIFAYFFPTIFSRGSTEIFICSPIIDKTLSFSQNKPIAHKNQQKISNITFTASNGCYRCIWVRETLNFSGFAFGQWYLSFIVPLLLIFTSLHYFRVLFLNPKNQSPFVVAQKLAF
jgi:hypothetical protein